MSQYNTVKNLVDKGVVIPDPDTVFFESDVNPNQIESGVSIMPGSRIGGAATVIGAGSVIGAEGPAVVKDCQIGRNVRLGSGYFESSVFLDGSSMGGGAHVRPGCILEEQASGAHTVGIKQTVLLPFVTLGSLINFCDCLMAGGTSRKNHSEVGSSYIHFNFTPHQDKATASLIGDVVHGVLLDQAPIFLGGQGGLAGPVRIAYGTIVPAGQMIRRDVTTPGQLVVQKAPANGAIHYDPNVYGSIEYLLKNNFSYIGHIQALRLWYENVRLPMCENDSIASACCAGAIKVLGVILTERVKRLGEVAEKLETSYRLLSERNVSDAAVKQKDFADQWSNTEFQLQEKLKEDHSHTALDELKESLAPAGSTLGYLDWVAGLDDQMKQCAVTWLGDVVSEIEKLGAVE